MKKGNVNALDDLIAFYYPDILKYCICYVKNLEIAEDLTQETFIKAVKYLDSYIHKGKFRAFLYKIAKNTCTDYYRKKKREPYLEELTEFQPYYENGFKEFIDDEDFKNLISYLTYEEKEIITLRFAQELKIREIADILNMPMRTVQSKLRKILKNLKKKLAEVENEQRF